MIMLPDSLPPATTAYLKIALNGLTGFADDYLRVEHAANHNLFTGIFDTYLTSYTKIIQEAESELLKTL